MLKVMLSTLSAVLMMCNSIPTEELPPLLTPCGMTAQELSERMQSPLNELAQDFLDAEAETSVNAVFLASIAALESGWGDSYAAEFRNNLFGIIAADGTLRRFESKRECIFYTANLLADNYLSEEGKHYRGGEVEDVAEVYASASDWAEKVRALMEQIGGEADVSA